MSDKPTIIDYQTKLCAAIIQPLCDTVWDALGEARSPSEVLQNIGAQPVVPSDGNPYVGFNGGWTPLTVDLFTINWGDIEGTLSNQTDLQAELDAKADVAYVDTQDLDLQNQIDGKAPTIHTHVESDIIDLNKYTQEEVDDLLAQKAALSHTHLLLDVTDSGEMAAIDDAPLDGNDYGRKDGAWAAVPGSGNPKEELVAEVDIAGRNLQNADAIVFDTPGGFDYEIRMSGVSSGDLTSRELYLTIIDAVGEVTSDYEQAYTYMRPDFTDNYPRGAYLAAQAAYLIHTTDNSGGYPAHVDLHYIVNRTDRAGFINSFHGVDATNYAQYVMSGYCFARNQPILQTRVFKTDANNYSSGIIQLYKKPRLA